MLNIFISYSYDSKEHEDWVLNLANKLEEYYELNIIFDKFDLNNFVDKNYFMEKSINDSDLILIIASKSYSLKANNRIGGVGIETSMASQRHWDELSSKKGSNIVLLLRNNEDKIIPNYLKSKKYINFLNDSEYSIKIGQLLELFRKDKVRPIKSKSIYSDNKIFEFNKAEEILSVNYHNKELKDCEKESKIKYDFWEVKSPLSMYILILYNNISIRKTIEKFIIKNESNIPKEMIVLRDSKSKKNYLEDVFKEKGKLCNLHEFTFSEFIWQYCIDSKLKNIASLYEESFFIDQKVYKNKNEKIKILDDSIPYIENNFINSKNHEPILFLFASAGMGKTTLSHILVNRINQKENKRAILIKSESFKLYENQQFFKNRTINTIYDLYEIYLNITGDDISFNRNTFELSFLGGNIIVLIDGLDEIITLFEDNFNLNNFIESLLELNSQLGKSKIIIFSRGYYWKDNINIEENENISIINLLGFDNISLNQYLEKRFREYHKIDRYIQRTKSYLDKEKFSSGEEGIISPFLLDLVSSVVEEEIKKGGSSLNLNFSNKNYLSNETMLDYLIYALLNREKERQGYEISIDKLIELFQIVSVELGDIFTINEFEEILEVYFGENKDSIFTKMKFNPFLLFNKESIKFKYDFLSNYFISLNLIDSISNSENINDMFIKHLSKLYKGKHPIFNELVRYFSKNERFSEILKNLNEKLIEKLDDRNFNRELVERSISSVLYIHQHLNGDMLSRDKRKNIMESFYGGKFHNIYIWGDFFPLDLSNIEIWNSKFVAFNNLESSNLKNTKFYYSRFENHDIDLKSKNLYEAFFDNTCDLGNLSDILTMNESINKYTYDSVEKELKKFLRTFYERGIYKDKLIEHISYSKKISTINKDLLDYLVSLDFLYKEDSVKKYGITEKYKKELNDFLINNHRGIFIDSLIIKLQN